MSTSGHEDEELLARLASGEITEHDEPARSSLARDPALRARWEGLRALEQRMEELRTERRRVLERADRIEDAPGDEVIRDSLRREAGVGQVSKPRARTLVMLAAAAVILMGFFVVRTLIGPERNPRPDMPLGGEIELVAPKGALERGQSIAWNADLPPGGRFQLVIEGRQLDSSPFEEKMSTYTNSWTPTNELFDRSTGPIQVTISVVEGGTLHSSRRFEVSLSR